MANRRILNNVCVDAEEIKEIKGKKVVSIENCASKEHECVAITFQDERGKEVELQINESGEMFISSDQNVSPVFTMQWFRDLIGYKIIEVASDENDANGLIYLANDNGDTVTIQLDNSVLDGESIYVVTDANAQMSL